MRKPYWKLASWEHPEPGKLLPIGTLTYTEGLARGRQSGLVLVFGPDATTAIMEFESVAGRLGAAVDVGYFRATFTDLLASLTHKKDHTPAKR